MLIACWSAKGGSGTTVVSVALASVLARNAPGGVLLADLAGDVPAVLGIPEPEGPGLGEWIGAGADVPADALRRMEVAAMPGISVLCAGESPPECGPRGEVLAALLAADARPVVVDCGTGPVGPALAVAAVASSSLLVLRPCYLGLRAAARAPMRPSGVVLVTTRGQALGAADVEAVLGAPVRASIEIDPVVARVVDAGLLATRLPRTLARSLRHAA